MVSLATGTVRVSTLALSFPSNVGIALVASAKDGSKDILSPRCMFMEIYLVCNYNREAGPEVRQFQLVMSILVLACIQ